MRKWHYTVAAYFSSLLETGEIRVATAGISKKEKAAAWFSANPVWEETARKLIQCQDGSLMRGTKATTHFNGGGLIRIEVASATAPYTWKDFIRLSGCSREKIRALESTAKEYGAKPEEWFVSFKPVLAERWIAIEALDWERQIWEDFLVAYERVVGKKLPVRGGIFWWRDSDKA